MKKIINGKKYDTDTAKEVASYSSPVGVRDFTYYEEHLYVKNTGEYFLHGYGGPMTKYAEGYGNSWGWGEAIVPLTEHKAKAWAEKHLTAEEYEDIFGEVEE